MCRFFRFIVYFFLILAFSNVVKAQVKVEVRCGDVIEAELTATMRLHSYGLLVQAGTELSIGVVPIGSSLNPVLALIDQGDNLVALANENFAGEAEAINKFVISSGNPEIIIVGNTSNVNNVNYSAFDIRNFRNSHLGKTLGLYQISIGCILRDGTVINPGDTVPDATGASNTSEAPDAAVSIPSLPDFSTAQTTPLTPGTPVFGAVSPGGTELFAYTIDAEGGSLLDLTFSKLSGNLNLSFAVLSSDNQILF